MNRKEFNFEYPHELVAQAPLPEREQSKLLFWDGIKEQIQDRTFSELPSILRERFPVKDFPSILLVVNDSKVFPARLRCRRKSGGRAEVFVLSTRDEMNISCLLRPQKKLRLGEILYAEGSGHEAIQIESLDPPCVKNVSGKSLLELLANEGEMPLPPYIERDPEKVSDPSLSALDQLRYQTVYAKDLGSAAAPTAGLHFTPSVLENCDKFGIRIAPVTLHVGLGTFQPVTANNIHDHNIHSEICCVPRTTMESVLDHINNDWPIIFVGTTSLRCVESVLLKSQGVDLSAAGKTIRNSLKAQWKDRGVQLADAMRAVADVWHSTNLFIRPSSKNFLYNPSCGNGIITNFHQPESTLAMLIAALLGYEHWSSLYRHAVSQKYRLFSYGDSSLLLFPEEL